MTLSVQFLRNLLGSQVAPTNSVKFTRVLHEADMRLAEMGNYSWCRRDVEIPVSSDGTLVLGSLYSSILGVQAGECRVPVEIHTREHEYVPGGSGNVTEPLHGQPNHRAFHTRLVDLGYAADGARRYKLVPMCEELTSVTARVLLAPPELLADTDVPLCPHLAALKLAMMAIVYEELGDLERAVVSWKMAKESIESFEKSLRGGARAVNPMPVYRPGAVRGRNMR